MYMYNYNASDNFYIISLTYHKITARTAATIEVIAYAFSTTLFISITTTASLTVATFIKITNAAATAIIYVTGTVLTVTVAVAITTVTVTTVAITTVANHQNQNLHHPFP